MRGLRLPVGAERFGRRSPFARAALVLALATLALLLSSTAALAAAEVERNDTRETANGPLTGDQTITGSITPVEDVDFFRIEVTTAAGYRFSTEDPGGNGCSARVEDPMLEVYNSRGDRIGLNDDSQGFCARVEGKLERGTYFVAVRNCCEDEVHEYTLAIDEGAAVPPECSDDLDNDADGNQNFPDEQGCSSADDDSESPDPPQCSDRIDNDFDGFTNFPADRGCSSPADNSEAPRAPQCSDGLDNDFDGRVNYPADPGCSSARDDDETDPARRPCTIEGGSRNDILRGGGRNDVICGGGGNDIIYGFGGNDILRGGSGNDILRGGSGSDQLLGGPGNDQMFGGPGYDRLFGGPGANTGSD